jgi:2-methylcitrate dehydratase PrpD
VDVALDIRARRGWSGRAALESIERVDVETYAQGHAIVSDSNPTTPYRAKFSLAYCVAAALLEGRVGLDQFSPERFDESGVVDPATAALLPRIHVEVSDDLSRQYPLRWPTRVRVTLRDGSAERGASEYPRGNPENPVSTEALEEKFLGLVAPRYGDRVAHDALERVRSVGECTDVAAVFAALDLTR